MQPVKHPFAGVIGADPQPAKPIADGDSAAPPQRREANVDRRKFFGYSAAAVAGVGALMSRSAWAQDEGGQLRLETDTEGQARLQGDDARVQGEASVEAEARAQHRRNRRRRRDREEEEWWDRMDSYYFGQNWWGPEYRYGGRDRYRGGYRGGWYGGGGWYTTQALYEEGGRGGGGGRYTTYAMGEEGGRGRYTTQAVGEEGGRGGGRGRYTTQAVGEEGGRGGRDRDRNRYTTQALGEEGGRGGRNRDRNRYTTQALGEEG